MIIGMHAYNALLWVKHHEMLSATERNLIGRRTESDWTADGIRSDGERNPIGRRTETDRTADGIRSDGERCFKGVHLSPLGFAACQSKKCTNKAILK